MSTPQGLELERDSALDDDFGLDRALRIVKLFNTIYGRNKVTKRYLTELTDILIAVKQRARARHQDIERQRIDEQIRAQVM